MRYGNTQRQRGEIEIRNCPYQITFAKGKKSTECIKRVSTYKNKILLLLGRIQAIKTGDLLYIDTFPCDDYYLHKPFKLSIFL